jgi:hypothetical protein
VLDLRQLAWQRWQAAAGPWRGWAVCHVLAAPEIDGVTPSKNPTPRGVDRLVQELAAQLTDTVPTAVILDLEPIVGLHVAAQLNAQGAAHAVLILPRWAYAAAILPTDGLLDALISQSNWLTPDRASENVVFVLDAERTRPIRRPAHDHRADNRYRLVPADLPDLASFRVVNIG